MNNKWILSAILLALLVIGGLVWWTQDRRNTPAENPGSQQPVFDPKNPNFVLGEVISVAADRIEFQAGPVKSVAMITDSTKLVKQVKDNKTNSTANVEASLADFKAKQMIVVYFSSDPVNQVYSADKIQLIKQ